MLRWLRALPDLACAALIALIGLRAAQEGLDLAMRAGLAIPTGSDPAIWGRAALLYRYEAHAAVPVLYPMLLEWISRGHTLVEGALWLNAASLWAAVVAAALAAASLCRRPWARRLSAISAALIPATLIEVAPTVYYISPELLTMALIAATGAAGAWAAERQRRGPLLLLGALVGCCFSVREHGIVIALALLPALALALRGPWERRLGGMLLALLGLQVGACFWTGEWLYPFYMPRGVWHGTITKAMVALSDAGDLAAGRDPGNLAGAAEVGSRSWGGGLLGQAAGRALEVGRGALPLLGGALLGLIGLVAAGGWRRGLGLCVALSPLAAVLVVWSEARHVLVISALAGAAAVGGLCALLEGRLPRLGPALVLLGLLVAASRAWPVQQRIYDVALYRLLQSQPRQAHLIELGRWLAEHTERGSVVWGDLHRRDREALPLLSGLHLANLQERDWELLSAPPFPHPAWRLHIVSVAAPTALYEELTRIGEHGIYRLRRPEGQPVDCLYGRMRMPPYPETGGFTRAEVPEVLAGCTASEEQQGAPPP